ncbi:KTSC domain-containing protein [Sinorhizobium sp. B11]
MSPVHNGQGGHNGQGDHNGQGERDEHAANPAAATGEQGTPSYDPAQSSDEPPVAVTVKLASHLISEITYDPVTRILEIEHRLKGHRRYFDVPQGVVINLVTAPSPGWYYTQHIRDAFRREDAHRHFSFHWLRSRDHHH